MKTKRILLIIALVWLLPAICNALYQPIWIVTTLIRNQLTTVYTDLIDTSKPSGDDSPSEADDNMRRIQGGFQEILAVEHNVDLTGTVITGDATHTDITTDSIVNAGTMTNAGTLGVTGDFAVNTDKFTVTAASGNTLVAGTLDVTGNIDPTTYEITNGGFLDEDDLSSDAADKVASQQSIKAYVDNTVPTSGFFTAASDSFNVSPGSSFEDLDISSSVGANAALVFYEVKSTNADVKIKPKGFGGVAATHVFSGTCAFDFGGANQFAYGIVTTNASGVIQIQDEGAGTWTFKVLGFVN